MVSAVVSDIACVQVDFGTGRESPPAVFTDSMAIGVQYVPRWANAAYALAIVSGERPLEPRVSADGFCGSLVPSPCTTPSLSVMCETGHMPMSWSIWTK